MKCDSCGMETHEVGPCVFCGFANYFETPQANPNEDVSVSTYKDEIELTFNALVEYETDDGRRGTVDTEYYLYLDKSTFNEIKTAAKSLGWETSTAPRKNARRMGATESHGYCAWCGAELPPYSEWPYVLCKRCESGE